MYIIARQTMLSYSIVKLNQISHTVTS